MLAIEIKKLKKHFRKIKAVDDISFDVRQGEIFGFLGPNGAGKTTTIRCLMDFLKPDLGVIKILGKDAQKDASVLKNKIGFLSGHVRLYNWWTGQEHIDFVEKIRGKSQLVKKLIRDLNFDPKLRVKHLSSGNYQKLGLILALMSEPKILIMDEPTLGLDPLLQNMIYKILIEFQRKGTTIFISSHNLPEVEKICHRVGIIKEGKLVAVESISDLKSKKLYTIEVSFSDKFAKQDFNIPGVKIDTELPDSLIISAKGDLNPLIQKLAKYKIKNLTITHASLEDIFLEFYERK